MHKIQFVALLSLGLSASLAQAALDLALSLLKDLPDVAVIEREVGTPVDDVS